MGLEITFKWENEMKKIVLILFLGILSVGPFTASASSCTKLKIVQDGHFAGACYFKAENAGSLVDDGKNLTLTVACYKSEGFLITREVLDPIVIRAKKKSATSAMIESSDEDDYYYEQIEINGKSAKYKTWSVRLGAKNAQVSIFKCL